MPIHQAQNVSLETSGFNELWVNPKQGSHGTWPGLVVRFCGHWCFQDLQLRVRRSTRVSRLAAVELGAWKLWEP